MTTELVLLLGLFVFILSGAFLGDKGPRRVFESSAPKLGARVEKHIRFGHRFYFRNGPFEWGKPKNKSPWNP